MLLKDSTRIVCEPIDLALLDNDGCMLPDDVR